MRAVGSVGYAQELYLKWPLTTRPIVESNVLARSDPILVVANDVLVGVIVPDALNELL